MNDTSESAFSHPWFGAQPWWIYIAVEASLYLIGLGVAAVWYAVQRLARWKGRTLSLPVLSEDWTRSLQKYAGQRSRLAIAVEVAAASLNAVYVVLYVCRSYEGVSRHLNLLLSIYLAVEVCISALLTVPLVLRLLYAQSPLEAWLSPYTIVDFLTLPHPVISLAIGMDWLGLRSLRFISFNSMYNTLVQLRVFRSTVYAELAQLLIGFVTIWLAAAGLIHLFEASGDPWKTTFPNNDIHPYKYMDYVYFAMTTMTTVGYGDISPDTAIGRFFVTFFMVAGIALFGLAVGPLTDLLGADRKYYRWYRPKHHQKHIVICGSLSAHRMTRLLQDLLHPDRVSALDRPDLVFLSEQFPTADMKRAVQSHFPHARLLVGSPLKRKDLQRVHLKEAGACIILADMTATEEESADGSAVMRCIAVKNFTKDVRVIMQVLKYETAKKLQDLPCWNRDKDTVVCTSEWRLGWLASACSCPGLSTILGNLLYPTAHSGKKDSKEVMDLYSGGASHEIYSVLLPVALADRSPKEVVYICKELGLLMIAIELRDRDRDNSTKHNESARLHLNPSSMHLPSFGDNAVAYILAGSRRELKPLSRLNKDRVNSILLQAGTSFSSSAIELTHVAEHEELPLSAHEGFSIPARLPPLVKEWEDHFVLCLLTNKKSPAVDLSKLVSTLVQESGSHLVVVAEDEYVEKLVDAGQTKKRHNDAVHFVAGSPLDKSTLLRARVERCRCCALFTVNPSPDTNEPALWDKDAILCLRVLEGIEHSSGGPIPVVVELLEESNVQFVSLEEDEEEEAEELHLSLPYAFGQVTAMGMLDVVLSASYFDAAGTSIAESILKSVCVKLVAASDLPYHMTTFGQAFIHFLTKGRLCVAVKRLKAGDARAPSNMYLPITAPRQNLELLRESDILVVVTHEAHH